MTRFLIPAATIALLAAPLLLVACNGDDGGNDSDDNGTSPTPFIAPEAMTTSEAIALLDEIEANVEEPNRAFVGLAQVSEGEVQERSLLILNGVDDVSGLDDVRMELESGQFVGAGEYLYNVVRFDVNPLSEADSSKIDADTLDEIDPAGTFDEDHSDGMVVSGVFKDAVLKMMRLWYGLLGEPPEDTPAPS
jgi:hypothetical protein